VTSHTKHKHTHLLQRKRTKEDTKQTKQQTANRKTATKQRIEIPLYKPKQHHHHHTPFHMPTPTRKSSRVTLQFDETLRNQHRVGERVSALRLHSLQIGLAGDHAPAVRQHHTACPIVDLLPAERAHVAFSGLAARQLTGRTPAALGEVHFEKFAQHQLAFGDRTAHLLRGAGTDLFSGRCVLR
jgi:hypothetical protein